MFKVRTSTIGSWCDYCLELDALQYIVATYEYIRQVLVDSSIEAVLDDSETRSLCANFQYMNVSIAELSKWKILNKNILKTRFPLIFADYLDNNYRWEIFVSTKDKQTLTLQYVVVPIYPIRKKISCRHAAGRDHPQQRCQIQTCFDLVIFLKCIAVFYIY